MLRASGNRGVLGQEPGSFHRPLTKDEGSKDEVVVHAHPECRGGNEPPLRAVCLDTIPQVEPFDCAQDRDLLLEIMMIEKFL